MWISVRWLVCLLASVCVCYFIVCVCFVCESGVCVPVCTCVCVALFTALPAGKPRVPQDINHYTRFMPRRSKYPPSKNPPWVFEICKILKVSR